MHFLPGSAGDLTNVTDFDIKALAKQLDEWIIGFEFNIRITKKNGKRDSKRGISDFLNVPPCVYILDLQQSNHPAIQSSMGRRRVPVRSSRQALYIFPRASRDPSARRRGGIF